MPNGSVLVSGVGAGNQAWVPPGERFGKTRSETENRAAVPTEWKHLLALSPSHQVPAPPHNSPLPAAAAFAPSFPTVQRPSSTPTEGSGSVKAQRVHRAQLAARRPVPRNMGSLVTSLLGPAAPPRGLASTGGCAAGRAHTGPRQATEAILPRSRQLHLGERGADLHRSSSVL